MVAYDTSQIYEYTQRIVQNKTHLANDTRWWNGFELGCEKSNVSNMFFLDNIC